MGMLKTLQEDLIVLIWEKSIPLANPWSKHDKKLSMKEFVWEYHLRPRNVHNPLSIPVVTSKLFGSTEMVLLNMSTNPENGN